MRPLPSAITRVFLESFTARDIAEPLPSFDATAPSETVSQFLKKHRLEFAGVREEGVIVGCVHAECLKGRAGACGQYLKPFDQAGVLEDSAPLLTVFRALSHTTQVAVRILHSVGGMVTRTDLHKPPVRMWLFGIVTLIEMRFTNLIDRHCADEEWKSLVSEARLAKAADLLEIRKKTGQSPRLLDCLQFSDKGQLVARIERLRNETVFASRRQAEKVVRQLEQLRNNLAHSQDIVTGDWDTIVELSEFLTQQFDLSSRDGSERHALH